MTSYFQLKQFEDQAERLGLKIKHSKYHNGEIGLYPTPEHWPCYAPDFEMAGGSVETLSTFMFGLEKGLQYAQYLGWNREKAESKYRIDTEKQKRKHDKNRTIAILKDAKDPGAFKESKIGAE